MNLFHYFTRYLFWPLFFISHLLLVSLLSWHLWAQVNFAYPTAYKLLDIEAQVKEFAPHNRHKQEFEHTTPEEHWQLFGQIVSGIQHHGKGLAKIEYRLPDGTRTTFMHNAEVVHLQDVANLIDGLYTTGTIAGVLWVCLLIMAYRKKLQLPALRKVMLGSAAAIAIGSAIIVSLGATQVFYWFHTKIFPEGHQWFFYYEDSLMTTLMKAPDIFGLIAVLLLALAIVLWLGTIWASNKFLLKNHRQPVYSPSKKAKRRK